MKDWLVDLLRQILSVASGPIRDLMINFATDLRNQAKATPNPWDDILADIVCWLFGVK